MRRRKLKVDDSPTASETHQTNQLILMKLNLEERQEVSQSAPRGAFHREGKWSPISNYSFATFIQENSVA